MSNEKVLFEDILEKSNIHELKKMADGMYQIYQSFVEAGFSKSEAMTLMVSIMQGTKKV